MTLFIHFINPNLGTAWSDYPARFRWGVNTDKALPTAPWEFDSTYETLGSALEACRQLEKSFGTYEVVDPRTECEAGCVVTEYMNYIEVSPSHLL